MRMDPLHNDTYKTSFESKFDEKFDMMFGELYEFIQGDYTDAANAQIAVWEDRAPARHPLLLHCGLPSEVAARFPDYNAGEIHADKEKMLLHGMKQMLATAMSGMQAAPSLRADMGCGIYPSLFPGIKPRLFYDDRMPWVVDHLSGGEIRRLREKDIVFTDEFKIALEHMAYQAEKIGGSGAFVYPLDLQSPFDMAHLVYGDEFFYSLYDDPELIHHLLELCVHAIILGHDECMKLIPGSDNVVAHYNELVMPRALGGIKISEDTSTLVCADHIDEYVMPYTDRVLRHTGGGYIHYCGRNDHLLRRVLEHELVRGLNFGNPDKHNMDAVLRRTSEAGKVYYGNLPMSREDITGSTSADSGGGGSGGSRGSGGDGGGMRRGQWQSHRDAAGSNASNVSNASSASNASVGVSSGSASGEVGNGFEKYLHYFKRCIDSATASDGKCRLLLSMHAPTDERDCVIEAWHKACNDTCYH